MKTETEKLTVDSIVDSILPQDNKLGNMQHTSREVKRIALREYIQEFADQEKAALKERLKHEATVDSIVWAVLQIDRMSNQEFDSERERRHMQIRKVQEIIESI